LVNDNSGIGKGESLALAASRQQDRRHRRGLADAVGLHVRLDELHGVVNREPGRDRTAWTVDVKQDIPIGVFRLEEQHLGDRQVGDPIIDGGADENDAVFQQPREDVVSAFAAVRLLDDHRHELHPQIRKLMTHSHKIGR
jgi:hypothetical protein